MQFDLAVCAIVLRHCCQSLPIHLAPDSPHLALANFLPNKHFSTSTYSRLTPLNTPVASESVLSRLTSAKVKLVFGCCCVPSIVFFASFMFTEFIYEVTVERDTRTLNIA